MLTRDKQGTMAHDESARCMLLLILQLCEPLGHRASLSRTPSALRAPQCIIPDLHANAETCVCVCVRV